MAQERQIAMKDQNTSPKEPFFILGSPRSGTTLLRDILRSHKNLAAPEETHFYSWSHPFGTGQHMKAMQGSLLKEHRKMDGIDKKTFSQIYKTSYTKRQLYEKYMSEFIKQNNYPPHTRWFDKTPQNAFGFSLLAVDFRKAKFIHIVRNPINVISSFLMNKTFPIHSVKAACNYWYESVANINFIKTNLKDRLYEFKYEDLTSTPNTEVKKIFEFINEDFSLCQYNLKNINQSYDYDDSLLNNKQKIYIYKTCKKYMRYYGYENPLQANKWSERF